MHFAAADASTKLLDYIFKHLIFANKIKFQLILNEFFVSYMIFLQAILAFVRFFSHSLNFDFKIWGKILDSYAIIVVVVVVGSGRQR